MSNYVFDPVAVVVDWLDACRTRRLSDLLDLYDAKASFRCACEGLYQGREELTRYWSTRFERAVPNAFFLTDLAPDALGEHYATLGHFPTRSTGRRCNFFQSP
jgi:hypothetical protein